MLTKEKETCRGTTEISLSLLFLFSLPRRSLFGLSHFDPDVILSHGLIYHLLTFRYFPSSRGWFSLMYLALDTGPFVPSYHDERPFR